MSSSRALELLSTCVRRTTTRESTLPLSVLPMRVLSRCSPPRALQRNRFTAAMATSAPAPVHLAQLELAHADRAAVVLQRAFDNEYSWSRPLGMPQERFALWLKQMYLPQCAKQCNPQSLIALCADAVAGVCTLEDFNAPEEPTSTEEHAGMAAIDGILRACKAVFWREAAARGLTATPEERNTVVYVAFLAVACEFQRRGVGDSLVKLAVEQLEAGSYPTVVAFCTSKKSAALFRARGFERWGGVSYQEYALPDGRVPFASLPQDECAVMVRIRDDEVRRMK